MGEARLIRVRDSDVDEERDGRRSGDVVGMEDQDEGEGVLRTEDDGGGDEAGRGLDGANHASHRLLEQDLTALVRYREVERDLDR